MKTIKVEELKQMIDNGSDFQLIDVRNPGEFEDVNMNGILIPLPEISDHLEEIREDVPVVIHCRSGARSAAAILTLESLKPFQNLYNLEGGIMRWIEFNNQNTDN